MEAIRSNVSGRPTHTNAMRTRFGTTSSLAGAPAVARSSGVCSATRVRLATMFRPSSKCTMSSNSKTYQPGRSNIAVRCAAGKTPAGNDEDLQKEKAFLESIWKKDEPGGPDKQMKNATDMLDDKIDAAVKGAEKACEEGTPKDCAVAWEVVEELAVARQNKKEPPSPADSEDDDDDTPPPVPEPDEGLRRDRTGLAREEAQEELPALRLMREERPCSSSDECTPPTGSFERAAELEAMFQSPSISMPDPAAEQNDERAAELQNRLGEAISEAEEACKDGTTKDCAVAWDQVDDIAEAARKGGKSGRNQPPLEAPPADEEGDLEE